MGIFRLLFGGLFGARKAGGNCSGGQCGAKNTQASSCGGCGSANGCGSGGSNGPQGLARNFAFNSPCANDRCRNGRCG